MNDEPVNVVLVFRKTEQSGEVMIFDKNDDVVDEWEFVTLPELVDILDELFSHWEIGEFEVRYI